MKHLTLPGLCFSLFIFCKQNSYDIKSLLTLKLWW